MKSVSQKKMFAVQSHTARASSHHPYASNIFPFLLRIDCVNVWKESGQQRRETKVPHTPSFSTTVVNTPDVACLTASFSLPTCGRKKFERFENRLFGEGNVPIWNWVFAADPSKRIISATLEDDSAVPRATFHVDSDYEVKKVVASLFSTHRIVFSTHDRLSQSWGYAPTRWRWTPGVKMRSSS